MKIFNLLFLKLFKKNSKKIASSSGRGRNRIVFKHDFTGIHAEFIPYVKHFTPFLNFFLIIVICDELFHKFIHRSERSACINCSSFYDIVCQIFDECFPIGQRNFFMCRIADRNSCALCRGGSFFVSAQIFSYISCFQVSKWIFL